MISVGNSVEVGSGGGSVAVAVGLGVGVGLEVLVGMISSASCASATASVGVSSSPSPRLLRAPHETASRIKMEPIVIKNVLLVCHCIRIASNQAEP